jgi:hypothetical protein
MSLQHVCGGVDAVTGMGWRNSYEMTAAMPPPRHPVPLARLAHHHQERPVRGAYFALTVVAMLALMRYRRSRYSMQV